MKHVYPYPSARFRSGKYLLLLLLLVLLHQAAPGLGNATTRSKPVTRNPEASANKPLTRSFRYLPPVDSEPFANNVYANTITQTVRQPINPLSAYDINGQITSYTLTSVPQAGTLHIGTDGPTLTKGSILTPAQASQLYYTPPTYWYCVALVFCGYRVTEGSYSFTYTATDNNGNNTNPATYTIPVGTSNTPTSPVAASIATAPLPNSSAATPVLRLSATGGDINGYRIKASSLPSPQQGLLYTGTTLVSSLSQTDGNYTLSTTQANDLRFDPAPTFAGLVTFQYAARNAGSSTYSDPATYTIPVYGVPNLASITLAPRANTSGLAAITPLSATDADGTVTSFTLLSLPTSGTLYVNGTAVTATTYPALNGQLTGLSFLPAPGSSGNVTFTYTATDNEGNRNSNGATYTIPVTLDNSAVYPSGNIFSVHALTTGFTLVQPVDNDGVIANATRTGAALPDFLTLQNNGSIVVNGNPARVGTYATTITLTDALGGISSNVPVSIEINADLYQANNDAVKTGDNCYELTPNQLSKRGEVWKTAPIDLSKSFEISFSAFLGANDAGADGIAFALQRQSVNPLFAAGQTGEGLGVGHGPGTGTDRTGGVTPSVVVEFDTYQNVGEGLTLGNEPEADHIAIFLNGEERTPVATPVTMSSPATNTEDGKPHAVRIVWDKDLKILSVFFDGVIRTTHTADLQKDVFGGDPMVYFGFTASTGGMSNQQSVCEIRYTLMDHDGDGMADALDLDSDNDGISNLAESGNVDPFADHDADSTPNYRDADFCSLNSKGVCENLDQDGDGYINALDLDADNDGIPDAVEANGGILPANMQAIGQYSLTYLHTNDTNRNGMADLWESAPLRNESKDKDGIPNALDLDSDADGILDALEANGGKFPAGLAPEGRFAADYVAMHDADQNGIVDALASAPLPNGDVDLDGIPNFLDADSDNDGIIDWLEAQPEGAMVASSGRDANGDGLDDAFQWPTGSQGLSPIDTDQDSSPDFLDLDSDGDLVFDYIEAFDTNKDGKSADDIILLGAAFTQKATTTPAASYYPAPGNLHVNPDWMGYAPDGRMNFLSPSSSAFYKDSDQDGLVDLVDEDSFGNEPTPAEVNYSFRSASVVTPLPVQMVNFSGKSGPEGVKISWQTASEQDNAYFLVERSTDGKTFGPVGQVQGAGHSNVLLHYSFLDKQAGGNATVYYRLKQVDLDGTFEYSKVIAVQLSRTGTSARTIKLKAYPNPTATFLHLDLSPLATQTVRATIMSIDGRGIKHYALAGGAVHALDVSTLPSGIYLLHVQGEAVSQTLRFMKE
ncbi:lectin-like domain-containing protein [Rufibacter psychrotolerans]|uniref:lectin-like domain-containing protein n=1 Tax=Rufibacter psychrotolerans TaxID=2812556 RepID=UPI001967B7DD|nr:T9SS type A sorting domain-containing protein [Rufibacter sp. SYSU D00308]